MPLKMTRILWLWAALLTWVLITWVFVLPEAVRLALGAAVLMALSWGWVRAGRQAAQACPDWAAGQRLPPAGYRQPVILVGGDGLPGLFATEQADGSLVRVGEKACYLRLDTPDQLLERVEQVLVSRPHWGAQLAVQWQVNPATHTDQAVLAAQLRGVRHQLELLRQRGQVLPLLVTGCVQGEQGQGGWFAWQDGQSDPCVYEHAHRQSFAHWQLAPSDSTVRSLRLQTAVQLRSAAQWWHGAVLAPLQEPDRYDPPCTPVVWALTVLPSWPCAVVGNLWQQWLIERCGLPGTSVDGSTGPGLPFVDALAHLLPRRTVNQALRLATVRGLWLLTAAAAAAMASSAWQNTLLVRQLNDDIHGYHTAAHQPLLQEPALNVLREDAALLTRHYRHGVPLHLGLGFYRGEPIRLPLLELIARHRPPVVTPEAVRLDSLALFEVASAELKPGSDKLLIKALVGIKAQPGWLIVIAGHTDSSGDGARNLQLSQQRAESVRQWMQRMGDIPDSCFAVQGHGASQPIASNGTPLGRGLNRRVDIRLLPEEGACRRPDAVADLTVAQ
ncbi:OmpA family protein [Pseudomonas sp. dw_358]|uniref:OmpA family protein n=1 Tax=Pseudomonas sp. dw_358 TaxID=2720083 RepID=UPI002116CDF8|nr:OmpA family protein [Pseudomonas sp. dw_358]